MNETQGEWKIHLTMAINFISRKNSKDFDKNQPIHLKSDNTEIMMGSETDEIFEELFESLLQRLEESKNGSDLVFDNVDALYYNLNKISLNRVRSYIDSPKWLKNKKAIINPKNYDDKCFQYALVVALSHEQIKNHPERISKTKPFIDQYNWKEIDFLLHKKDWKKFELNNKSIALNILCVPYNAREIRHAYKSKYSLNRENQVILLMITDGKKWHYLAVKSLRALLRGITSNNIGTFIA